MGDMADDFRIMKKHRRDLRTKFGVECPTCKKQLPKAQPKILLPGQRCWCGYRDLRKRESK